MGLFKSSPEQQADKLAQAILDDTLSAHGGKTDCKRMKKLLANGADPSSMMRPYPSSQPNYRISQLNHAFSYYAKEPCRLLIEHGAKLSTELDKNGSFTPLLAALAKGWMDIAELIVEKGETYLVKSPNNVTALHMLAPWATRDVLEKFVALGVDPNEPNLDGETPLYVAVRNNNFEAAGFFLSQGADVRALCKNGNTVLHAAAKAADSMSLIDLLISHGADISARNGDGFMPWEVAAKENHQDVAFILRQSSEKEKIPCDTGWHITAEDEIALVSEKPAVNLRLTELFNFASSACVITILDTKTNAMGVTRQSFAAYDDAEKIAQAEQVFVRMNGMLPENYQPFSAKKPAFLPVRR